MSEKQGIDWLRAYVAKEDRAWDAFDKQEEYTYDRPDRMLAERARRGKGWSKTLKANGHLLPQLLPELSPERFIHWISYADPRHLGAALTTLDEPQRRTFSKVVDKALRDGFSRKHVALAAHALCGFGSVKRADLWDISQELTEALYQVLSTRKPEWLQKWVSHTLEGDEPQFGVVHRLVEAGLCPKPTTESYYAALIQSDAGRLGEAGTLYGLLRDDPTLVDDALKAFELDPAGGVLFDPYDWQGDGRADLDTWMGALTRLMQERHLDRERLLSAALGTLRARIQLRGTAFYVKLLEQCSLTPEETQAHEADFIDLLAHPVSSVVKHALSILSARIKSGHGDESYVRGLPSVFEAEAKGNALSAIRLLHALGKKQLNLRPSIAIAAAHGLQHASADVQEKALDLVEAFRGSAPEPLETLRQYADLVAATNRARLAALLGEVEGATTPKDNSELSPLLTEARSLPRDLSEFVQLPRLIAACEAGSPPAAFQPSSRAPRLSDDSIVQPIASFDELVDCLLAALEEREDAMLIERCLDGISRFAHERPPDIGVRTSALLQAASTLESFSALVVELANLIIAWLNRQPKPRARASVEDWFRTFFAVRTTEIAQRAKDCIPAVTLSLPTHSQGWIAASVLVERLRATHQAGVKFQQADFVQALLRLAPDGRAAALQAAQDLPGEMGQALRYALGGELHAVGPHPHFWAAAARARYVAAEAPELRQTPAAIGPYAAESVSYEWRVKKLEVRWASKDEHRFKLEMKPEPTVQPGSEYFPATMTLKDALRAHDLIEALPLDARLHAMAWPSLPDAAFWRGAHAITDRLFRPASTLTPTAPYLEPLFDPDVAFNEPARVCLVLALVAQDADARTTGADVLSTLMEDGRSDGTEAAETLVRMHRAGTTIRLGRLTESLNRVYVAGPAQHYACSRFLEAVLMGLGAPLPKDAHHVVELLAELNTGLRRPCPTALRSVLESIKGSGKAAKAAKRILTQAGEPGLPADVAAVLLRSRIERVR
ncbi:MAG: hypothetical protein KC492_26510, partial [Myxococcales bacterium]|nr:hypothetical protein [Myxococcales bacterium]